MAAVPFSELTRNRFSLRRYAPDPVPDDLIDHCLEAARNAPSACNSQPWTFLVVRTPEKVAEVARGAFSGVYSMNAFAKDAPVLVVVITERAGYAASLGGLCRGTKFSLLDVGMACEHLALQAAELGLGTCMLGWFNERAVKRALDIPRMKKVDLLISLGYPAKGTPTPAKRRKPLDDVRRLI